MRVAMYYSNKRNDTPPFFARPTSTSRDNLLPPVFARSRDSSLTLRNRLRNLVEDGCDVCTAVVAGFIPALWSAERQMTCA